MSLSDQLSWRNMVNQTTLSDISELDNNKISFYFGVDPSADSMTVGNLAAAMVVRHFIDAGHKAYLLVGGATGLIGDPDGKKDERNLLTVEDIERNKAAIASQYKQIFAGQDFEIVDNYDWFKDINYLDFLRDIGKHVPVSQMLGREFVQSRLGEGGSGISYAEFSYALIQGYDFVHLFRDKGVTMQLCGADQWGNSIAGVDLIRRLDAKEAHVLSMPLVVNKTTGKKFGKSEDGAIWLDENKTSVYAFYQFWLNAGDDDVVDYLKTFTVLSKEEIEALAEKVTTNPGAREAQKALAHEVTTLVHGAQRTASVERVIEVLFGGASFESLDDNDIEVLASEIPSFEPDLGLIELLTKAEIAASNGEARRLLENGAVSVNGEKVFADQPVHGRSLIKKGKNSFILVR